jgi:hypothetical protein
MTTSKYLLVFLLVMTASSSFAQQRKRIYKIQSAYTASYLKAKSSFEPYKEIKTSRNGWLVEFSSSRITFKKSKSTEVYQILKAEGAHGNATVYSVRNQQGNASVMELRSTKIDSYVSINIDIFDLNKDGSYKAVTKYVVKQ